MFDADATGAEMFDALEANFERPENPRFQRVRSTLPAVDGESVMASEQRTRCIAEAKTGTGIALPSRARRTNAPYAIAIAASRPVGASLILGPSQECQTTRVGLGGKGRNGSPQAAVRPMVFYLRRVLGRKYQRTLGLLCCRRCALVLATRCLQAGIRASAPTQREAPKGRLQRPPQLRLTP